MRIGLVGTGHIAAPSALGANSRRLEQET